jgi:haloalkane dehalogenase
LVESLGLTKITLVLNEWGGPIGLTYAAAHPQNLQRILLTNTWAFLPEDHFQWELSPAIRAARGGLASIFLNAPLRIVKEGVAKSLSPDAIAGYKFGLTSKHTRDAVRDLARQIPVRSDHAHHQQFRELHGAVTKITCRTEILWGVRDPLLGTKIWPYLFRDALPNAAEPEFLESSGRYVTEDAPDRVIDKLLEIFKPKPAISKPALNILK